MSKLLFSKETLNAVSLYNVSDVWSTQGFSLGHGGQIRNFCWYEEDYVIRFYICLEKSQFKVIQLLNNSITFLPQWWHWMSYKTSHGQACTNFVTLQRRGGNFFSSFPLFIWIFFPPFSLTAFPYHPFYLLSFLSTLKHFPHSVLSLLHLYPLPSFLLHSFHIPFICTSYCHSLLDFITVLEASLYFPDILAVAEESLWFPVFQLWCVGFWLLLICFNCPFDNENEEISHLTYIAFHFGSYIGGGS